MKFDVEDVKKYFSKFSKKEQKGKQPIPKEIKKKTANLAVLSFMSIVALSSCVGTVRTLNSTSKLDRANQEIQMLKNSLSEEVQVQTLDVSKVQFYMSNFVYDYINVDPANKDERRTNLANYFSFSSSTFDDEMKEKRILKTQRLISLEEHEDYDLAIIRVGYEIGSETKSEILAVPFRMSDGVLAIVSPVYPVAENLYQGESEPLTKKSASSLTKLSQDEQESIAEFLPVFFEKYASSDETDLKLLMKEPFFMGGDYQVKSVELNTALYYEQDDNKMVQVAVDFANKHSGAVHTEHFTLQLVKQDTGWYVEQLYHYYKG